jgi:hypothetical protein
MFSLWQIVLYDYCSVNTKNLIKLIHIKLLLLCAYPLSIDFYAYLFFTERRYHAEDQTTLFKTIAYIQQKTS